MSPKKVAIGLLTLAVICIIIIVFVIFYFIISSPKNEDMNSIDLSNESSNFSENDNFSIENFLTTGNVELSEEFLSAYPDVDFNFLGTDWSFDDDSENMIIEEPIDDTVPPVEKELSQEQLDNINFSASYENMPEESKTYINNAFGSLENFEKELKKSVYNMGLYTTTLAKYNTDRKINNGRTVLIYFDLDNYYDSSITTLINLDDNSWDISEGGM